MTAFAFVLALPGAVQARHGHRDWSRVNAGAVSRGPNYNTGNYTPGYYNSQYAPAPQYGSVGSSYYNRSAYNPNPQWQTYETRSHHRTRNIALAVGAAVLIGVALGNH